MDYIDRLLNRITMYRVTLYGLTAISLLSVLLGFFGVLAYGGVSLLLSLILLIAVCAFINYLFSFLFKAPTNIESVFITAYILFFVLAPLASVSDAWWLAATAAVAMASKYILAIKKRHVFNPAALGVFVTALFGSNLAIWWVATPVLLPVVAILGLLVVRKIRRFDLFFSYLVVSVVATALYNVYTGFPVDIVQYFFSWPVVFFGTIMLTEPITSPPSRRSRVLYGTLVALLSSIPFHIGPVFSSLPLALVLGNVFSYAVGSKQRLTLAFKTKKQVSENVYEFVFKPDTPLRFAAGQYMEWTLPHHAPDTRGNRRYFTIASAPSDSDVRLGMRIGADMSSFKKALFALKEGATLTTSSLAGEFVLPKSTSEKLVFIAGGVGITPFVSMLRHLLATHERRDIVLFYAASSESDFAYRDVIQEAEESIGLKVRYVSGGYVTEDMIREVSDYHERAFYISGPDGMVRTYKKLLVSLGIPRRIIKTDFFPGLV